MAASSQSPDPHIAPQPPYLQTRPSCRRGMRPCSSPLSPILAPHPPHPYPVSVSLVGPLYLQTRPSCRRWMRPHGSLTPTL